MKIIVFANREVGLSGREFFKALLMFHLDKIEPW